MKTNSVDTYCVVALDPSQLISCGGSAASVSATAATTTSSVTLNANLAALGVRTATVNNATSGSQTEATRLVTMVIFYTEIKMVKDYHFKPNLDGFLHCFRS